MREHQRHDLPSWIAIADPAKVPPLQYPESLEFPEQDFGIVDHRFIKTRDRHNALLFTHSRTHRIRAGGLRIR